MKYTILLIVLPLLFAFISILFKKGKENFLYLGIVTNVVLLFLISQGEYAIGGFLKPYGITLVLDQYSYIGVILINLLFVFSVVTHVEKIKGFSTVLLTLLAGLNGLLLTGDLFNLFVFLEVTSISAYILTTQSKKYYDTFHYLIVGSIASGLYLLGTILLYASYGSLNLSVISSNLGSETALILPLLLIFAGLSVETKLFPVNGWVKNIYKNANGLIGTLMASIVASASLLVMGRILNALFVGSYLSTIVMGIAIITLITGEFAAFKSKTIKEILLYSSIGQGGLVTLLMVTGFIFPAVLIVINNAIAKLILFAIGDLLSSDNVEYQSLKGKFHQHKLLGVAFTIASFSLIGLPLFLGFYAKVNTLIGLFSISMLLPGVILLITIIEGAYLIRLNITLWHPSEEGHASEPFEETSKQKVSVVFAVCFLAAILVIGGLVPNRYGELLTNQPLLDDTEHYLLDMKGGM